MSCMRCGKETDESQVFCAECLADMERHPVKSGTPIQLPHRPNRAAVKRASFQLAASKWQDRIFRLKYIMFWLIVLIVLLTAALVLCICMLLQVTPEWINELFFENQAVQSVISNAVK